MIITAEALGIRFMKRWLFQNLQFQLSSTNSYAITGANGSGKSTLLQLLIGFFPPTIGKIEYSLNNQVVDLNQVYKYISVTTPYLELIEDFTLSELWEFHAKFKQPIVSKSEFMKKTKFELDTTKQIKFFSSGMKQRLKLGLCFYFHSQAMFFDEPTTNLDDATIAWYLEEINNINKNQKHLLVICSNDKNEYDFCNQVILLQ